MLRYCAAALLCIAPLLAGAAYPDKPVRPIVPFPPGSITDVVARSLAQGLNQELKQPIVAESRAGANGIVGTGSAARASLVAFPLSLPSFPPISWRPRHARGNSQEAVDR